MPLLKWNMLHYWLCTEQNGGASDLPSILPSSVVTVTPTGARISWSFPLSPFSERTLLTNKITQDKTQNSSDWLMMLTELLRESRLCSEKLTCCWLPLRLQNVSWGACPWSSSRSCSLQPPPKHLPRCLPVPQDEVNPCRRCLHGRTDGGCPQSFHTTRRQKETSDRNEV